jgi:hypothetical protein
MAESLSSNYLRFAIDSSSGFCKVQSDLLSTTFSSEWIEVRENKEDINALKQRLNDEIDALSKNKVWPPLDQPMPPAMVSTGFPMKDIREQKSVAPPPPQSSAKAASEPVETSAPSSLLARLKQQAAEKLASEAKQTGLHKQQKRVISDALSDTYSYLCDLTNQVNVLKPDYPSSYFISEHVNFDALAWQEGRADYRVIAGATEDRLLERVTLHYVLSGKEPIIAEKEYPGLELLTRTLNDHGLSFETKEFKNERGRTERSRFSIKREVRAGLLFVADYVAGDIRLRTLNVQRFGSAEYRIPAEILTHATVEEIALLVLGASNQFVLHFKRVA